MSDFFPNRGPIFTVHDWYWIVGDDTANVWSSKRAASVPVADSEYVAWLGDGMRGPTRIGSMEELSDYFSEQYPPGMLETYAAFARWLRTEDGLIVTSISPVPFDSDAPSRNALANGYEYIKLTPGSTANWKLSDGSFVVLTESQLRTATTAMATFVQNCFTCESEVVADIGAGTVTTQAQIEAAFDAVSNVA